MKSPSCTALVLTGLALAAFLLGRTSASGVFEPQTLDAQDRSQGRGPVDALLPIPSPVAAPATKVAPLVYGGDSA